MNEVKGDLFRANAGVICVPVTRLAPWESESFSLVGSQLNRIENEALSLLRTRSEGGFLTDNVNVIYEERYSPIGKTILALTTKDSATVEADIPNIVISVAGLMKLAEARGWDEEKIAIPALGCGTGRLEWREVSQALSFVPNNFIFYLNANKK